MIGYWHHSVVYPSVHPSLCNAHVLWLSGPVYRAKSCTGMFLAGMFLFREREFFWDRQSGVHWSCYVLLLTDFVNYSLLNFGLSRSLLTISTIWWLLIWLCATVTWTFFWNMCKPASCLHHLLPPSRNTSAISRLRSSTPLLRPTSRTKKCESLVNFALNKYQSPV